MDNGVSPLRILLQGFDHHVRNEHNMWAYVFFLIHLEDVKTSDFTALELYVHKLVSPTFRYFKHKNLLLGAILLTIIFRNIWISPLELCTSFTVTKKPYGILLFLQVALENYDFFPMNRALCLTSVDTDSTESKIDELLNRVTTIALKQKEEVIFIKKPAWIFFGFTFNVYLIFLF